MLTRVEGSIVIVLCNLDNYGMLEVSGPLTCRSALVEIMELYILERDPAKAR